MRTCNACGKSELEVNIHPRHGKCSHCRYKHERSSADYVARKQAEREANKENLQAKRHAYYKSIQFTINSKFARAKARAKKRGIDWLLSLEEFIAFAEQPCHYCHQLFQSSGCGLDRIDNDGIYEASNCLPCCSTCNIIRNKVLTVEQTEIMVMAKLAFDELTSG